MIRSMSHWPYALTAVGLGPFLRRGLLNVLNPAESLVYSRIPHRPLFQDGEGPDSYQAYFLSS